LQQYIATASPSGAEVAGQKVWINYIKPFVDTIEVDNYGNTVAIINPKAKYKVVIEAHADEISWVVKHITDGGMLRVIGNGGMDAQIAPSKRIHIHTPKGIVNGVFGWPAIHVREPNTEKQPTKKMLWIDVGAKSKKEVEELGIHIGCHCTYDEGFSQIGNDFWVGRAFDNKIGGFMIAEVARLLKEKKTKLPFGLYIVNAVQEEVGLNGASMIVETIAPDVAIITDVTHDTDTPNINKDVEGDIRCGDGPAIGMAPSIHTVLMNKIWQVAKNKKIPYQLEVMSPSTGTDTDAFAYGNCGVPSALISMPLRYMHTSVEMCASEDVYQTIQLMYYTLLALSPKDKYAFQ
jgi:putative aminopeptidase FrvX